jgi:hypothetical protein
VVALALPNQEHSYAELESGHLLEQIACFSLAVEAMLATRLKTHCASFLWQ